MSLAREFMSRLRRTPREHWPAAIQARKASAYQQVFGSPEGQIVLQDLLREAGLLSSSVTPGDAYDTHRKEGRREIGLHLISMLAWSQSEVAAFAQAQAGEAVALVSLEEAAYGN